MDSEIDSTKEEKLKSLLGQLEVECGIFERIVYKNKNQHRRSSYFQYLLKVSFISSYLIFSFLGFVWMVRKLTLFVRKDNAQFEKRCLIAEKAEEREKNIRTISSGLFLSVFFFEEGTS